MINHSNPIEVPPDIRTASERAMGVRHVALSEDNGTPRLMSLARSFPCIRHAPCVALGHRFDAPALDAWARKASSGERHAIAFILSLYNSTAKWKCGPFNLAKAVSCWDSGNLAAFQAWAAAPFTL